MVTGEGALYTFYSDTFHSRDLPGRLSRAGRARGKASRAHHSRSYLVPTSPGIAGNAAASLSSPARSTWPALPAIASATVNTNVTRECHGSPGTHSAMNKHAQAHRADAKTHARANRQAHRDGHRHTQGRTQAHRRGRKNARARKQTDTPGRTQARHSGRTQAHRRRTVRTHARANRQSHTETDSETGGRTQAHTETDSETGGQKQAQTGTHRDGR